MQTEPLESILSALKTVLRGRETVAVPDCGIDVMFDSGVIARCRACRVAWTVRRSQFRLPGWWACPSGCRPPERDCQKP